MLSIDHVTDIMLNYHIFCSFSVFAVSGSKGISVYVLEGILYDEESKDVFLKAMDASTRSLKKTDRTAKASGSGDDQS